MSASREGGSCHGSGPHEGPSGVFRTFQDEGGASEKCRDNRIHQVMELSTRHREVRIKSHPRRFQILQDNFVNQSTHSTGLQEKYPSVLPAHASSDHPARFPYDSIILIHHQEIRRS